MRIFEDSDICKCRKPDRDQMLVDVVPDKPVAVLILELTGFGAFPADLSQPFLQMGIAGIYPFSTVQEDTNAGKLR